jgi:hypothetical protein
MVMIRCQAPVFCKNKHDQKQCFTMKTCCSTASFLNKTLFNGSDNPEKQEIFSRQKSELNALNFN